MKRFLRLRYLLGIPAALLAGLVAIGLAVGPPPPPQPAVPVSSVAASALAVPTTPPPAPGLTVARVADGDTVTLSDGRKVRILGIDTPESVKPNAPVDCFGLEASAFAKATLAGKGVTVTGDPTQDATDRFGRHLAYVNLADGRDYSVLAAEAGMARTYVYAGKPVQRHPVILAAEQRAKAAKRGLWGVCAAPVPTSSRTPVPIPVKPPVSSRAPLPAVDEPDVPAAPARSFASCAAARAAGAAPLRRGSPGYASKLDRDGDGVACE